MINPTEFLHRLKTHGVEFITGVPDTLLNDLCAAIENQWDPAGHILAANEGNAIGLAAGHHLGSGRIPLVYMQNSGLGNATNPLVSLADTRVYAIPMVLVIGWRGQPGSRDWPQHSRQGEIMTLFLEEMGVPYRVLDVNRAMVLDSIDWAVHSASERSGPTALVVQKGVFDRGEKADHRSEESAYSVSREDAMAAVLEVAPSDAIFVASTGRATRELYNLREIRGESHHRDFLNVGAMGHASSIAAGIASAQPDRTVICFDGDAAAIMHMGSLVINSSHELRNFLHIVLNNGAHESVGGQPSAGFQVDLTSIAMAAGYRTNEGPLTDRRNLQRSVTELISGGGPGFIDFRTRKGMRKNLPKLIINPTGLKAFLMKEMLER